MEDAVAKEMNIVMTPVGDGADLPVTITTAGKEDHAPTPKKHSQKVTIEEKFDRQKRILQKMVVATLDRGEVEGLNFEEVKVMREALVALGWIPTNLRL